MDIFILVPSLSPEGPVKGAIALANELVKQRNIVLVVLKPGKGVHAPIDEKIKVISLYQIKSWRMRLTAYKDYLKKSGGKDNVASISSCFSADIFNLFCRGHAVTCSSVRGNLPDNYKLEYGWRGSLLALVHLILLRGFDHVVAMTASMGKQVSRFLGRYPEVIGNFVDEEALEKYRTNRYNEGVIRFVFVGSLTIRKRPLLLINAIETLSSQGYKVRLEIIGEGPLRNTIESAVSNRGLDDIVHLHGQLSELHHLVGSADVFVLPSDSEGLSRACMEALYLGVPVVLRDVDGNSELIQSGKNGFLFNSESELPIVMLQAANLAIEKRDRSVPLLSSRFSQGHAAQAYLDLVEGKS